MTNKLQQHTEEKLKYFKWFIKHEHDDYFLVKEIEKALSERDQIIIEMLREEISEECPIHAQCFRNECHRKKGLDKAIELIKGKEK